MEHNKWSRNIASRVINYFQNNGNAVVEYGGGPTMHLKTPDRMCLILAVRYIMVTKRQRCRSFHTLSSMPSVGIIEHKFWLHRAIWIVQRSDYHIDVRCFCNERLNDDYIATSIAQQIRHLATSMLFGRNEHFYVSKGRPSTNDTEPLINGETKRCYRPDRGTSVAEVTARPIKWSMETTPYMTISMSTAAICITWWTFHGTIVFNTLAMMTWGRNRTSTPCRQHGNPFSHVWQT